MANDEIYDWKRHSTTSIKGELTEAVSQMPPTMVTGNMVPSRYTAKVMPYQKYYPEYVVEELIKSMSPKYMVLDISDPENNLYISEVNSVREFTANAHADSALMMTRNEAKYFVESQDMYWLKYKVVKNGVIQFV